MTDLTPASSQNPPPIPPAASLPPVSQQAAAPNPLANATMQPAIRAVAIGGDTVRFDLNDLYTGLNDPQINTDLTEVERLSKEFEQNFRGKLSTDLGAAMEACEAISRLETKVDGYISLRQACDVANEEIKRVNGQVSERLAKAGGDHFSFFSIEIGKIDDQTYAALLQNDPRVAKYQPYLDKIRENAKHLLSEEVERALALRSPFGVAEWREYFEQRVTATRFKLESDVFKGEDFNGQSVTEERALKLLADHPRPEVRAALQRIVNETLAQEIVPLMATVLNNVAGVKNVEDGERKRPHIMSSRNKSNMVSDDVVDTLHKAVADKGSELCKRFYKLKAAHLGIEKLAWSDRNAPLRNSESVVPWDEATKLVVDAYRSFSPTLASLVENMFASGWIDAPHYEGKRGGAFNMSLVLPEPLGARSYTFLNYQGKARDVATLAHELGHGVHGILAGKDQGVLMYHAPIAYCETASIFGEMVTFEYLKNRITDPQEKLTLLMGKINDFMNTVVRQISFSMFEQKLHEGRKQGKLTSETLCNNWMEVTEALYGKSGDVFTLDNMKNMWSYIPHFIGPFYVYGYAFGELLTQSLYAVKDSYGANFEPLYLDLLKAGSTKDAVELLKPFGLDPRDPSFWQKGMEASVGKWLDEAEALSKQLGIVP